MKHRLYRAASALTALAAPGALHAQSFDRAAFEALFGEPVTTSATGAPQRASEVPAAMIIITGDELRRTGARNIAEALRGHAGIDVNRMTALDDEVAVRGGNQPANPRLLVMVNGRQVYLDHYGVTSWANIGVELSEIRQVEVVKGPVSALFGFNAASGAINIVTYDPLSEGVNAVSGEFGNEGQRTLSGVASWSRGDRFGLRLSGGYAALDEFEAIGQSDEHSPDRANLALDAHALIGSKLHARLNLNYTRSRETLVPPGFFALGAHFTTKGGMAELSSETGLGLMSLAVQYNHLDNGFEYGLPGLDIQERDFSVHLLSVRFQDVVKASAHDTIRTTLEFRTNEMHSAPDLGGELRYRIYSGGLMWDRRLTDTVTLNLAGRVDHLARNLSGPVSPLAGFAPGDFHDPITAWSANAGLVVRAGTSSTVRLQAARGVQAPSLVSTGIVVVLPVMRGVDQRLSGNPRMAPTVTESAELGYVRSLPTIEGSLTSTLFWSRTHPVATVADFAPSFTQTGILLNSGFVNQGSFESFGVEAALSGKAADVLRWRLSYTFNAIDEDFDPGIPATSRPFEALTPRHKLGVSLGLDRGPITLDLRGLLRSDVTFPLDGRQSGWTAGLDTRLGLTLNDHIELYGVGENLTGAPFIDNGYVRQSMRVRFGVRVTG